MKIGALIPIRLTSERLPGKALLELAGRPVVAHLLDRVAACKHIASRKDVVVCTTKDPEDDALVRVVESEGCSVFRGHRDDIVARFSDAIRAFDFDAVVQADGDDPLSATEYMDATMDALLADETADIVTVTGVPLGTATKSFRRRGMDIVEKAYRTVKNDTGFIYFFTKSGLCRHVALKCSDPAHVMDKARLTLDYDVDYEVFSAIFQALYRDTGPFCLADTVAYLKAHPEVASRNLSVEQEYWQRTADKAFLTFEARDGSVRRIDL